MQNHVVRKLDHFSLIVELRAIERSHISACLIFIAPSYNHRAGRHRRFTIPVTLRAFAKVGVLIYNCKLRITTEEPENRRCEDS